MRMMTFLLLGLAAGTALAEKSAPQVGQSSRAWLELQRSGTQAAEGEARMPGEVAERVYQRYLNSFDHPIPEHYPRAGFRQEP